jgi:hypothetical protein
MLPYNGNGGPPMGGPAMGGGDLMAAREFEATRGGGVPQPGGVPGGDVDSLMSELMQITQRAEQIISQLESQGVNPEQLLAGGGPTPVGVPGGMPQTPVGGNTGPPGGMPGLIA